MNEDEPIFSKFDSRVTELLAGFCLGNILTLAFIGELSPGRKASLCLFTVAFPQLVGLRFITAAVNKEKRLIGQKAKFALAAFEAVLGLIAAIGFVIFLASMACVAAISFMGGVILLFLFGWLLAKISKKENISS